MEEVEVDISSWKRLSENQGFLPLMFFSGLFLSIIEPTIRYFSGKSVSDSIWPHAYRTLVWTMGLRENLFALTLFLSILLFLTFLVLQRQLKGRQNPRLANGIGTLLLGILVGFITLFFALDIYYLRGAFLLLPTLYGFLLLSILLVLGGFPHVSTKSEPCLLYTSPSPRDGLLSRMPSSA